MNEALNEWIRRNIDEADRVVWRTTHRNCRDVVDALSHAGQSASITASEFKRQTNMYPEFLERVAHRDGFKPIILTFDDIHTSPRHSEKEPDQKISYDEVMGFGS